MSQNAQGITEVNLRGVASGSRQFVLLRMFSKRWILATLLVFAAMAVMARLGIWQLDRLHQRRAFNTRVLAQINQPVLDLTTALKMGLRGADLTGMEYRQVKVQGQYDFSHEVALRNQAWGNEIGVHLLTPLHIAGSDRTILVDRGWVPVNDFNNHDWSKYAEPGTIQVSGVIRASNSKPDFGFRTDPIPSSGQAPLLVWNFANVDGISKQIPYTLLPVYIQQAPDSNWTSLPYRTQPVLDLSEGPHQSYAIQWFSFAALLGIGYPFFIRRQENPNRRKQEKSNAINKPA
jgi:surfeit locus 1 family protein